ncbi:MAG TPA: DUF3703 domain-containing protein [Acidimicrobiales bacterium]
MTATRATARPDRFAIEAAWTAERGQARAARAAGDQAAEWRHLERAHILSQPLAWPHLVTHAAMFAAAWRRRDARELAGQAARLLLAVPGSVSGRYPVGNTGGADVSAFRPMPIPDDLRSLLAR